MIRDDVADLRRYLIELRELLFDQASGEAGSGGKVVGSPAPWNDTVGELLTDIHAGARRLAREWAELANRPMPPLGAVDAGTMRALDFVGTSVEKMSPRYPGMGVVRTAIHAAEREVNGWARRCRQELGIERTGEENWTRAPGGLRCPNAGCGAELWLQPGWSTDPAPGVYCRREQDGAGRPIVWTYEEWHRLVA